MRPSPKVSKSFNNLVTIMRHSPSFSSWSSVISWFIESSMYEGVSVKSLARSSNPNWRKELCYQVNRNWVSALETLSTSVFSTLSRMNWEFKSTEYRRFTLSLQIWDRIFKHPSTSWTCYERSCSLLETLRTVLIKTVEVFKSLTFSLASSSAWSKPWKIRSKMWKKPSQFDY